MVHGQEGVHRYGVGNIKRALRDALDKHDRRLPPRPTGTTSDVGSMKLLSAMARLDKELPDTAMLGGRQFARKGPRIIMQAAAKTVGIRTHGSDSPMHSRRKSATHGVPRRTGHW